MMIKQICSNENLAFNVAFKNMVWCHIITARQIFLGNKEKIISTHKFATDSIATNFLHF